MKKIFILISFFVIGAQAQEIKSPAEILQLMTNSTFRYEVYEQKDSVQPEKKSDELIDRIQYVTITDSESTIHSYRFGEGQKEIFTKAEDFFDGQQYDSAAFYYQILVNMAPTNSLYKTYFGQALENSDKLTDAESAYRAAIAVNRFDYMAHWFLADIHYKQGRLEEAVDEITTAIILNRNNARIAKSFERIFKAAHHENSLWVFTPQIKLVKTGVNQVEVHFNSLWIGYAMAKAYWEHEPDYKENFMKQYGMSKGAMELFAEKECLVNEVLAILQDTTADYSNDIQLRPLVEATKNDVINGYFLFEILLPENPKLAYVQSEKVFQMIKNYIITVRNPLLPQ